MAYRHTISGFQAYIIKSEESSTQATFIPERGGWGSSIIMTGHEGKRELLFQHDYCWETVLHDLPGGWPFCFPVCGRLERNQQVGAYYYDGKLYNLPIHGFSWSKPWKVGKHTANSLQLALCDDEQTRCLYPFEFTVELFYEISPRQLLCTQTYTNHGDKPMPYYAGFHPYFLTPGARKGKDDVILNYHPVRRFRYNQTLTDLIGEQPLFTLPTSITNPSINEQLTQIGDDKTISLRYPNGDVLNMTAWSQTDPSLFSYVQLYTISDKPFICIEPWMAYPNALNSAAGARWLQPGQSEQGRLKLSLN